MDYKDSIEATARYVRLALPLMSKLAIPITPVNYAVWYNYVSGINKELKETIDSLREKGESFSEELNEKLYRRFLADKEETALKELRENLSHLLVSILGEVASLSGHAEEYESMVSESVDKLSDHATIQDVRNVVDEIISKTKRMGKSGRNVQNKLNEATRELEELKKEFEQAKTEAAVDFLTGVGNRKAFDETLTRSIDEAVSYDEPLSLVLIDIDHIKQFNDEHGHIVGDEVLRFVANQMKEMVRGRDFVARYGGEEFAVILPKTPLMGAKIVAENLRAFFAQKQLKRTSTLKPLGKITISLGAVQHKPGESKKDFIIRADQALYMAKGKGRNRVVTEKELA